MINMFYIMWDTEGNVVDIYDSSKGYNESWSFFLEKGKSDYWLFSEGTTWFKYIAGISWWKESAAYMVPDIIKVQALLFK